MSLIPEIRIADFTYQLPEDKIALYPLPQRDESKLLVYKDGCIEDSKFLHLDQYLPKGASIFFNQSKVVFTRLFFEIRSGQRPVEIFCLEPADGQELYTALSSRKHVKMLCMVGRAKKWKDHSISMQIPHNKGITTLYATKISRKGAVFEILFEWDDDMSFAEILELAGHVPLPPYIRRLDDELDKRRYQTIYAQVEGSVAAPTAGLHFTDRVFNLLKEKNISFHFLTLHVGAGTFAPVKSEYISGHKMHGELIEIRPGLLKAMLDSPFKVAVGTTSLRTLESIYHLGIRTLLSKNLSADELEQWCGFTHPKNIDFKQSIETLLEYFDKKNIQSLKLKTQLIIAPGYKIRTIDALITNFHQPSSTLLLLVSAVTGGRWKEIYNHALSCDYRFLSYGDSSLLFIHH
ncbi:S-adenosylmethionine:tRNA ribosyltransferase-isomerase [Schleiferia thermophila]|jgi:S-adenosylmethionine:tRNA ribosyltransferase-isomerase|uniref:S-adenosylmethionine:tRNA ribosyltransferase-isomerase n=1 Tax=Schleiferia thermophila TaxID=884107 RepID=A0A368ZZ07_9FLAO|nr:S-adenosylmethionine:tRNA ribosyltransferase-isomerase [Schleiferia thermophila]RCX02252.1 S-adenosylmethionine:tRNA ribosyltransferase-isomerase [Schleiferia thermophila]GCD80862.1 S-adenosylmethionine:tRNA ribosyltransferase-isomerase [Schleiferia thermophila]